MFITDQALLSEYALDKRYWQGIPGVEVTAKGRIFITFYSGGVTEQVGNYALLHQSDDGTHFGMPIAAALPEEEHRCFDPCLWIDPLGRLWFTWAVSPDHAVYAVICDDPDADELVWSKERVIGHNVMMNKPTVLSTGEWMFPMAVWNQEFFQIAYDNNRGHEPGSYAYLTIDNGRTFSPIGKADVPQRQYDEHMILEREDGVLNMYVRTNYGIGISHSYDKGKTWTEGVDSGIKGPGSRFCIRRLKSGRVLLVNHFDFSGRDNLTALLSEDDGKTWKYRLLLDERKDVSYPDLKEAEDGFIYIVYDRERGGFKHRLKDVMDSAREILYAKIKEEDIIHGKLVNPNSSLKNIALKLKEYNGDINDPFNE